MCKGEMLDNMAGLYPRAKTALTNCQAARSDVAALTRGVETTAAQAVYLEKLQPILQRLAPPADEQFAVFDAQRENWKLALEQVKQLSVPASFAETHAALLQSMSAIATSWNDLSSASSARDGATFRSVEEKLSGQYEAIRALEAKYQSILAETQATVSRAYGKL